MKFKAFFIITLITFYFSCATTDTTKKENNIFSIVEYGIFDTNNVGVKNTNTGPIIESDYFKLSIRTTNIPAKAGISFGFLYQYNNANSDNINIETRIIHPSFFDPYTKAYTTNSIQKRQINKYIHYIGYKLEDEYEIVPGVWKMEIWYNNSLVLTKTFILQK